MNIVTAQQGRTYAQVVGGRLHWIFTAAQMPEWATDGEFAQVVVDITDMDPQPQEGWTWNGTAFVAPQPPAPVVPIAVSRFQAKAALLSAGLLNHVEALMTDAATPAIAKLAWAEAIEFRRDSPSVAAMAASLSLSDKQLDDLFISADQIRA